VLPLVLPALVGVLAWLPWALYAFRVQLTHGLSPGGGPGTLQTLVQSVLHFFFWNASLGGDLVVRGVAWPGSVLAAAALLLGLRVVGSRWREFPEQRLGLLLLVGFGVGLPLWAWLVSQFFVRSTFGWRYLGGAAPALLFLAALGLTTGTRVRALRVALVLAMSAVTLVNVLSGGREDHRRLVDFVLEHARADDVVVVKPPWDRDARRDETTWRYYLDRVPESRRKLVPPDVGYDELPRTRGFQRAWVWFRDPYYGWVRRNLAEHFASEQVWQMGPDMTLHLFTNPREPP